VGGRLGLWGHGLRLRQLRGPPAPGTPPRQAEFLERRYDCQHCPAILTVVPSETVARRHYAATAIAFALALYGLSGQSHDEVRTQVSPSRVVGVSAQRRWVTLGRWIDAVARRDLFAALPAIAPNVSRRDLARRAAMAIGAHAPPSVQGGSPAERAFFGAAHLG
jgi:hypothetical protein